MLWAYTMFLLLRGGKWDCWEQKSTFERNQQEKRACGGKSISINISRAYIKVMWATGEHSAHGQFSHTCSMHMQTNSCISNTTEYPCNCPVGSTWSYSYAWICLNKEVILILLKIFPISIDIQYICALYKTKLHFTYFPGKMFK